jgi:hypothetical protein
MSTICFLTRTMCRELLEFVDELNDKYQNTYVMDDTGPDNINYDTINEDDVRAAGFWKVNQVHWIPKDIIAWDKALYYFCRIDPTAEYVWFIEDDVFIPRIDLISEIDAKHPDADLLTKQHTSRVNNPNWPGWSAPGLENIHVTAHYQSLNCAVRLSRRLLSLISDFANKHGQLTFLECFFNSLAVQGGLKVETPEELSLLAFEPQTDYKSFDKNHMYHHIKNYSLHPLIRKLILLQAANSPTIHYLTIATKPNPNLDNIKKTVAKNGDTLSILGLEINADNHGFGFKLKYLKDFIKDLDNSNIVLYTDAYDVIINGTLSEIQRRFINTGFQILFGAEKGCWPDVFRQYQYNTREQEFPYLNAGGFIGYVGAFKQILNNYTVNDLDDDQRFWTTHYLSRQHTKFIGLDHSNTIFFNVFNVDYAQLINKNGVLTYGRAEPLIFHFNGAEAKDKLALVWDTVLC